MGPSKQVIPVSSIHVYHFCLHVVNICSTWLTSCKQFEKIEGQSFRTGILVKGWRRTGQVRRYKHNMQTKMIHMYTTPWVPVNYLRAGFFKVNLGASWLLICQLLIQVNTNASTKFWKKNQTNITSFMSFIDRVRLNHQT